MRGKPDPNAKISFIHQDRLEKGDEFWALRNINLEIEEGKIFGIIGRNGAGKSTLLKILSQITAPTEGKIHVNGRMACLLEVGTGFHPELTGRENVFLNGAILGMSRTEIKSKFDEIVEFSEISEFIDTPVKRYSSGMYVRLAFGVAAHLDPDILIVDEVLAVGDAAFQKKCIGKMNSVSGQGRTVILVTHSMVLAQRLSSLCAWLQDGSLRDFGETKSVVDSYLKEAEGFQVDLEAGLADYRLRRGSGLARFSSITICDSNYMRKPRFERGEKILLKFKIKILEECSSIALSVVFKHGEGSIMRLPTEKISLGEHDLKAGSILSGDLVICSLHLPASIYDLYVWLGSIDTKFQKVYDVLDGVLPAIEITEVSSEFLSRFSLDASVKNLVFHGNE